MRFFFELTRCQNCLAAPDNRPGGINSLLSPCSPMAEANDLKSLKCGFESHHGYAASCCALATKGKRMSEILEEWDWSKINSGNWRKENTFLSKCLPLFDGRIHLIRKGADFKGVKWESLETRIRKAAKEADVTLFMTKKSETEYVMQKVLNRWVKQGRHGLSRAEVLALVQEEQDRQN